MLKPLAFDIWKANVYQHSKGIVVSSYCIMYPSTKGHGYRDYPIIRYDDGNETKTFYGNYELIGEIKLGDSVPVIFNPQIEDEVYVYTLSGFWVRHLGYLIPFTFLVTLFFNLDVVPRKLKLKIWKTNR